MKARALLLLLVIVIAGATLLAASRKIELPSESVALKPASGVELVQAQCQTCHSLDYVTTQPPLPRKYWKGAVEKMQTKFGAPIPPEQVDPLADYLTKNYGTETPAPQAGPAR
ncbi:MAG: sulfite dehydrogenase (cytochrome) subunit [Chthoniobacter sp.]|jgi:mono/diheme cytochrome c family protein|nr:sulfite dehydrogenase (cytochrome) subunit [Chthoniobacter sp.]